MCVCVCVCIWQKRQHILYGCTHAETGKADLVVLVSRTLPSIFWWRGVTLQVYTGLVWEGWEGKKYSFSICVCVCVCVYGVATYIYMYSTTSLFHQKSLSSLQKRIWDLITRECTLGTHTDLLQHKLPNEHKYAEVLCCSICFLILVLPSGAKRISFCLSNRTFPHVKCSRVEYWAVAFLLPQNEQ